jgi:hypothetical protein
MFDFSKEETLIKESLFRSYQVGKKEGLRLASEYLKMVHHGEISIEYCTQILNSLYTNTNA